VRLGGSSFVGCSLIAAVSFIVLLFTGPPALWSSWRNRRQTSCTGPPGISHDEKTRPPQAQVDMVLTAEVGFARDSGLHQPGHFANAPQSTSVIPSEVVGIRPDQVDNLRRRQRRAGERILDL
jgi:hypothetical protein